MSSQSVVRGSLRALDKGYAVYVPGWHFRLLAAVSRVAPRALARRLSGLAGGRAYRS